MFAIVTALAVSVLMGGQPTGPKDQPLSLSARPIHADSSAFAESFDGQPSGPEPWRPSNWAVAISASDSRDGIGLPPMPAHHGADCSAPPAEHVVSTVADALFLCNGHLMTTMSSGYGVVYLTPPAMADFSEGDAVVRFDLSTIRTSGRDWVDLWVTPYEDNLQLPLEEWLPTFQGEPRRAVHVRMDTSPVGTIFRGTVVRGFDAEDLRSNDARGYESVLTPSAVKRETFELRLSRTHVKFGMPAYDLWWIDQEVAGLDWNRGVVQFGHHSYNSEKDCPLPTGCVNTWHWDNISVSPSRPVTILPGSVRTVDANTSPEITFSAGAPDQASLRFAGLGANLEVSVDGGATWQAAQRQAQEKQKDEHLATYWMPIPPGTSSIQFRGQRSWAGPWVVRDASIWAQSDK